MIAAPALGLMRIVANIKADFPAGCYVSGAKNCVTKGFPFWQLKCAASTANNKKDAPMTIYGYVRCSTDKQTVLQQIDAIKGKRTAVAQ
jgi:hypothetical protein